MAPERPSKRARAHTDHEAGSNPGKRRRRSYSHESGTDAASEDGDESSEQSAAVTNEADDTRRYQTQLRRVGKEFRGEQRANVPAESGIIQEISCTNFMCHEQLTVTLGPLINFIIGHNGSGKSAVLTALTLCLGGRAAATNRGQNLKAFIKEGRDFCTLRVKIKNEGSAAYRPDMYGRSIVVERHFTRNGTSGFKLRDENAKVVSTKKTDVEDIIDAFALQLDNPMNVLTQDLARQFLNDSTPRDKYKFFLKGTQLQALRDDYRLIEQEVDEIRSKEPTMLSDVQALEAAKDEALKKVNDARNLATMRQEEQELVCQAAWASVEEEERNLDTYDAEIAKVSEYIERHTHEAEKHTERYEGDNKALSGLQEAIKSKMELELEPKRQECANIEDQYNRLKDDIKRAQVDVRTRNSEKESKDNLRARLKGQIEDERKKQADSAGGEHARKLAELEQAESHCKRIKGEHEGLVRKSGVLRISLAEAEKEGQEMEQRLHEKRRDIEECRRRVSQIGQARHDWTASYARNLPLLLKAIERENRFQERPIGPMGRHVKLSKPEWSSILEKAAGAVLNAFVVTSRADQTILSALMKRVDCNCPIYIARRVQIDTTPYEPASHLDTWLRVLTFDNEVVRSQFIINNSIEKIVLVQKRSDAQKLMHEGGELRRNVATCFTMSDNDPTKGHAIKYNAHSGAISVEPLQAWKGPARMQTDKEPQLRAARANLEAAERQWQDLKAEEQTINTKIRNCQQEYNDHKQKERRLWNDLRKAEEARDRLKSATTAAMPDEGVLEILEQNLQEAEEAFAFAEGQLEDIFAKQAKLMESKKAIVPTLRAAQAEINQLEKELDELNDRSAHLERKRANTLRDMNNALAKVEGAEKNRDEWEDAKLKQLDEVKRATDMASDICPRVEVPAGMTREQLMAKLEHSRRRREERERMLGGSEEDLMERAQEAWACFNAANQELHRIQEIKRTLEKAINSRQDRWKAFRRDISIRARALFGYLLSERQFRGELLIDHTSQQLDIQVQPDITVASAAGRQTKTLSGGEKSFSTICLLLALWDAMGSPIRCLDEFDVFMDSVNRDISMRLMIDAARRAVGRQYIMITPQAMNSIQSVGDVKIIKMRDPERGQTALNVGR